MKGRSLFHTPVILGLLPSHNVGSSEGLIGCMIPNYELFSPANPVSHLAATSGANVFAASRGSCSNASSCARRRGATTWRKTHAIIQSITVITRSPRPSHECRNRFFWWMTCHGLTGNLKNMLHNPIISLHQLNIYAVWSTENSLTFFWIPSNLI